MERDWETVNELLTCIRVTSNSRNNPVEIYGSLKDLKCIGVGTDAAVFQYVHLPNYAFKLYADDKRRKIPIEAKVYQQLKGSPFFPTCYAATERYLVVNYEAGLTLNDCLVQGIPIPSQAIDDVEEAREYARKRHLNPRDIHLRNVLLQNGRAKVIDVSEYLQPGNDNRWEHLKKAYDEFYHLIEGKKVPTWLLEAVQRWYIGRKCESMEEFMKDLANIKSYVEKGVFPVDGIFDSPKSIWNNRSTLPIKQKNATK
jgi:hypothetical protein